MVSQREVTESKVTSSIGTSTIIPNIFMFGASREMATVAITRAQTIRKSTPSTNTGHTSDSQARHSIPTDHIGQGKLQLSLGLANVATIVRIHIPLSMKDAVSISKDANFGSQSIAHAYFFGLELMTLGFKPTSIFHLAEKMLEGMADLSPPHVS